MGIVISKNISGSGGVGGVGKEAITINIDASVSSQIVIVPDANGADEIRVYRKIDATLNTVTLQPEIIGQKINDEVAWVLEAQGQYISIDAENGHWWIIGNN